jgi:uncharacterized protein YggE
MIALLLLTASPWLAAGDNPRFVSVAAEGYVEAIPDTLTLSISVQHTDRSMAAARKNTDQRVREVLDVARAAGVADEDIDSSRLNAFPQYEWRDQQRYYVGETVQRQVVLTLRDLDKYGELLQRLSEAKITSAGQPRLSHSELPALQLQALEAALAMGRRKAATIAAAVGAELGTVLRVEENYSPPVQPRMMYAERAMAADSNEAAGVSFAKQRINAQVQMRFELR